MYSAKFGIDEQKLMRKLWGDSFYNTKTKKWDKDNSGGGRRAFCQFILDTILKVRLSLFITILCTCFCIGLSCHFDEKQFDTCNF